MESENREAKSKARAKPPTRLQKHAPAALWLDEIANASNNCPSSDQASFLSRCAIPLLSPLILSPLTSQQQQEEGEKQFAGSSAISGNDDDDEKKDSNTNTTNNTNNNLKFTTLAPQSFNGWQHPAVEAFPDPSSLFTFFQSQCVLVNRVQ